jgi:hypothetical protein
MEFEVIPPYSFSSRYAVIPLRTPATGLFSIGVPTYGILIFYRPPCPTRDGDSLISFSGLTP